MDKNEARKLAETLVDDLSGEFESIADRLLEDVDNVILGELPNLDEDSVSEVIEQVLGIVIKRFLDDRLPI